MTSEERDQKIIEIHNDVRWIKDWIVEHKAVHTRYLYFFVITAVGLVLALIK